LAQVTVRLSRLAYAGLAVAAAGAVGWIVGELRGVDALERPARLLLLAGAALYLVARVRMARDARRGGG